MTTSSFPQWLHRQGNWRAASRGRLVFVVELLWGMDIYHKDPWFVGDERNAIIKASLDVDSLVLDGHPQVVVELVFVRPFLAGFHDLVDFTATGNVLVH